MSGPATPAQASSSAQAPSSAPTKPAKPSSDNIRRDCALIAGNHEAGRIIAATPSLGFKVKLGACLYVVRSGNATNPFTGFTISFPLGGNNEANGFGVRYKGKSDQASLCPSQHANSSPIVVPGTAAPGLTDSHDIHVRLPRGGYDMETKDVPPEVQAHMSSVGVAENGSSIVIFRLKEDQHVRVIGFGMPFANDDDDELVKYVDEHHPIIGDTTVPRILRQREFTFVVRSRREHVEKNFHESWMPAPFTYPYGDVHMWNPGRFWEAHLDNRDRSHFRAAYSYDDDNSYVAVVANFNAQDVIWVDMAATAIGQESFQAYFDPKNPNLTDPTNPKCRFYVIIPMTREFRMRYKAAWSRLAKDGTCKLVLASDPMTGNVLSWYVPRSLGSACARSNIVDVGSATSSTTQRA